MIIIRKTLLIFTLLFFFQLTSSTVPRYKIETLSGNPFVGSSLYDAPAIDSSLNTPQNVLLYNDELFISDSGNHVIRKVSKNGTMSILVGVGSSGYNGDGLLGTDTQLNNPNGLSIAPNGDLFFADTGNNYIRVLSMNTMNVTILRAYTPSGSVDTLREPIGVAVTKDWIIYITDAANFVKRVNYNTRIVTIVAGGGSGTMRDNVVPTTIPLSSPKFIQYWSDQKIVVFSDSTRARFFTDIDNQQLLKIYDPSSPDMGIVSIIPLSSTVYLYTQGNYLKKLVYSGSSSTVSFISSSSLSSTPYFLDVDKYDNSPIGSSFFNVSYGLNGNSSNVYISDSKNHCIRMYDLNTTYIRPVAGFKYQPSFEGVYGFSPFADLKIKKLIVTPTEEPIFIDSVGRTRMIQLNGRIKTLIGSEFSAKYPALCDNSMVALKCRTPSAYGLGFDGSDLVLAHSTIFLRYFLSTISGSSTTIKLGNSLSEEPTMFRTMKGNTGTIGYYYNGSDLKKKVLTESFDTTVKTVSGVTDFTIQSDDFIIAKICYISNGQISCFNETSSGNVQVLAMPLGETSSFTSVFLSDNKLYASTSSRIYTYSNSDFSTISLIAGIMPLNESGQSFDFSGYNGDYLPATSAILSSVNNLHVTSNGNIYFVSGGTWIRRISNGFVTTVGGKSPLDKDGIMPMSVTRDSVKKITYFIDSNTHIKMMDESSGAISPLTYPITPSPDPQSIQLPFTFLRTPEKSGGHRLTYSTFDGLLYVSDYCRIIAVNVATGSYKLVTGTVCGESADNILAINSLISTPSAMSVDSKTGDLYLVFGSKIKKIVKQTGLLTTLYGTGSEATIVVDGIISKTTPLRNITSLNIVDDILYFSDNLSKVRQLDLSNHNLTTLISTLSVSSSISYDRNGDIFILDPNTYTVRKYIRNSGTLLIVSGKHLGSGFSGKNNYQATNIVHKNLMSSVITENGMIFTENSDKYGLIRRITAQCDGNSTLDSTGTDCVCNVGYGGISCGFYTCFGLTSYSSDVCSGNGTCSYIDTCVCKSGFEGSFCNIVKAASGTTIDNSLGVILPAVLVPVLFILIIVVVIIVALIIIFSIKKKKSNESGGKELEETTYDIEAIPLTDLPSDMSVILSSSLTRSVSSSTNEEENLFTRYQDIEKIGQGAFGSVFKCKDSKDGNKVKAIKVLKFNSISDLNMIMKEGAQLTNAKHNHILKVNDYFITNDNMLCIDMDYYEKGDLSQFTKNDCAEPLVKQILYQLCDALSYVHGSLSMIHRDIKPTNIFVKEYDGTKVNVILADFGLAKQAQESNANSYAGTPLYMSPELGLGGKYYPNSDTYSLGVTIYQIMTKDTTTSISHLLLNDGQNAETKLKEKMKQAKMQYSNQLIDLVVRMLDKDSATRPNAQDILADSYFNRM